MRTIKFRIWNTFTKNMEIPDILVQNRIRSFDDLESAEPGDWSWGDETHEKVEGILMQYTGLSDKKGVEIYEGDIYTGSCDNGNQVVEFDEYSGGWTWHYYENPSNDFEVIGNIYKNPELLETT